MYLPQNKRDASHSIQDVLLFLLLFITVSFTLLVEFAFTKQQDKMVAYYIKMATRDTMRKQGFTSFVACGVLGFCC
jgi:hypothetical protein